MSFLNLMENIRTMAVPLLKKKIVKKTVKKFKRPQSDRKVSVKVHTQSKQFASPLVSISFVKVFRRRFKYLFLCFVTIEYQVYHSDLDVECGTFFIITIPCRKSDLRGRISS